MSIRVDPLVLLVRCYKDKVDPKIPLKDIKERYYKTLTVLLLDDGSSRVEGAVEAPTFKEVSELREHIKNLGYNKITWRHGDKNEELLL